MEQHQLTALVLAGFAIIDLLVAFLIVLPRAPEDRRTILQMAFIFSTLVLFGFATAFWFQWLDFQG